MKGKKIEAIEKLYAKFGNKPFRWSETHDLDIELSPMSIKHEGLIKKVKKVGTAYYYMIPDDIMDIAKTSEKKYRIRRKPHSGNFYANNLINKYQGKKEVKNE